MTKAQKKADLKWIDEAMSEFSTKKLKGEAVDRRAQYAENKRFLEHIKMLAKTGALRAGEVRTLQQAFSKAKRRDEDDPMLSLEMAYLTILDQHGKQVGHA